MLPIGRVASGRVSDNSLRCRLAFIILVFALYLLSPILVQYQGATDTHLAQRRPMIRQARKSDSDLQSSPEQSF